MHLGYACGLLTGAVLAAGFAARSRFDDDATRSGAALHAAIELTKTYPELSGSVNCRDITGVSLTRLTGRLRYVQQGQGQTCGRLHLKWAPRARQLIDTALNEAGERGAGPSCANCAVQTMRQLQSSTRIEAGDAVLLVGFAGGVGLLGNVCGALAAGVFALSADDQLGREQKIRDSRIRGSLEELTGASYRGAATQLRLEFIEQFGSDLCVNIIGRRFRDTTDHSVFVEHGGCGNVTKFVADWTARNSVGERASA